MKSQDPHIWPPYVSKINQEVPLAQPGEFPPLNIGALRVWPPVVLAPMAGITNSPFRRLCRRFGAGLYVSEMVTAKLLSERHPYTMKLAAFGADEQPRSVQLYGIDPYFVGEATKLLVHEFGVDHIDMNFGCPVRKVTIRGGGAAIPVKPNLLRKIVRAAVQSAGDIPVTIKFRVGIDRTLQTYLTAGKIAEEEGCAAVALHARTAAQLYTGHADWEFIARLKQEVTAIPVLGNGDVWEARDALRMMRSTGCDGVVVGRGCLGRPWLFRDLADVFAGREQRRPPTFGQVAEIMVEHARLLCDWFDERTAMRSFRKHCTWYVRGFKSVRPEYQRLVRIDTLAKLLEILEKVNPDEPFPLNQLRVSRGKNRCKQKVALPAGYLEDLQDET
ncbi:MAG: tRNA dihydrouridine synthase DusB, partial [bacterium]